MTKSLCFHTKNASFKAWLDRTEMSPSQNACIDQFKESKWWGFWTNRVAQVVRAPDQCFQSCELEQQSICLSVCHKPMFPMLPMLKTGLVQNNNFIYSKTCVKWPLSKRPKIGFQDQLSLNAGLKYCNSAILLTFIKLPIVIKIFVLSIFEWPFYTGFTVCVEEFGFRSQLFAKITSRQNLSRYR